MSVLDDTFDSPKIQKMRKSFIESNEKLRKRLDKIELGVSIASYIVLGTVLAEGLNRIGYPLSHMSYAICGMTGMLVSLKITSELSDAYLNRRERNFKEKIKRIEATENEKNTKIAEKVVEHTQVKKVSLDVKKPKKVIDLSIEDKPKKENVRKM